MAQKNVGGRERFSFPPWLPVAASVVLMIMVALVAASNARNLKIATQWRRQTTQTILAGQAFQNNLVDMQRGLRGYVTLGDTNALASFYTCAVLESKQLDSLVSLTTNNPTQQERLNDLGGALSALLSFDNRAIVIYRRAGFSGISKLDASGESRAVFGHAHQIMDEFSTDEQKIWDIRDATEQDDYHAAGRLLVIGSSLAAILLLLATFLGGRELGFRRRAEAALKQTLVLQNAILNSADYGIVTTDLQGIVQTFNPAAERLLGYPAAELVGKETPMRWRDPQEIAARAEDLSRKLGVEVKPTFESIAKKVQFDSVDEGEWTFIRKDGSRFPSLLVVTQLGGRNDEVKGFLGVFRDISERKKSEAERERLISELKNSLAHVKALSGLIPICAWCKSVRSDTGYWQSVEQYVRSHSEASFSHGVCPNCAAKFKGDALRPKSAPEEMFLPKA